MRRQRPPIGVILAGGRGRRIGGSKAVVKLRGQPLIRYPLASMLAVLEEVVVVAKPGTELPSLPGVSVWLEPVTPQHPLIGIIHALALAGRRPIVTCATDMPFVPPRLIEQIASAPDGGAPAIVAAHDGELHPLLGRYLPQAAIPLAAAAATPGLPLREAVRGLGPRLIEVEDAEALFNINAPEDLLHASAMLDRRISRT